jgi:putative transposase
MGASYKTFNRWKAKYGGMKVSEAQEKRRPEEENAKLRKLVAQFALDIDTLEVALAKRV